MRTVRLLMLSIGASAFSGGIGIGEGSAAVGWGLFGVLIFVLGCIANRLEEG